MTELCRDTKCPKKDICLRYRPNVFNHSYFFERMFKEDFDGFRCEFIILKTEKEFDFAKDSSLFEFLRGIVNGIK